MSHTFSVAQLWTGHIVKVHEVGTNFGYVAEVQDAEGRIIATTETYPFESAAFRAACDISAKAVNR